MSRSLTSHQLTVALVVWLTSLASLMAESKIDGFTEPYQTIEVSAPEMGTLDGVLVEEGAHVQKGQVLANLDEGVLNASLAIAETAWSSEGRIKSALAEVHLHEERLAKLEALKERNHASQVEVDRTRNQLEIAAAQLLTVREELKIKKLECQRINAQLEQRRIRAPLDGIVTEVYKQPGEFVASTDPVVVRIVQLDPLLVVFSVPRDEAAIVKKGDSVPISFDSLGSTIDGIVEYVSPTMDAQSGTIRIKVRLANPDHQLPCGESCQLAIHSLGHSIQQTSGKADNSSLARQ